MYGEVMAGFIQVHHLKPLARVGIDYQVDPIADLRPVCANCHAVLHRKEPPYSIEEVKEFIRSIPSNALQQKAAAISGEKTALESF